MARKLILFSQSPNSLQKVNSRRVHYVLAKSSQKVNVKSKGGKQNNRRRTQRRVCAKWSSRCRGQRYEWKPLCHPAALGIEGDGTNLTIASSGALSINNTGVATFSGAVQVNGNFTVLGSQSILETVTTEIEDNLIAINSKNFQQNILNVMQIN